MQCAELFTEGVVVDVGNEKFPMSGVDGRTVSTGLWGLEGCDKTSAGNSTNIC